MILRLIEHRSISAAAVDLRLSQSAVTKSLQEVESIFGVMLFHRESRGLRPTSYCEVVERFAREVVIGLDETMETLHNRLAGELGAVSIGAAPGRPQQLLASAMGLFRSYHPRVHVSLHEGTGANLLDRLDAGAIDFALMSIPPQLDRERFARVALGREPAFALARPQHPLLQAGTLSLRAVLEANWVLPPLHDGAREWLFSTWLANDMEGPSDAIEADAGTAMNLAAQMDLVCLASETLARPHMEQRRLVPLAVPVPLPVLAYGLVRYRRRNMRPGALHALRAIREALRHQRQAGGATPAATPD
jgi:DNA-binding transcriptional LysR family regulator